MSNYQAILIVEDDLALSASLERSFLRRNFQVATANSVKDAKLLIEKFHPTHAVVDLKIAQESGLDFVKYLHEFDAAIKIIVLTGYASITTTIEAIKSGAFYYLAKPANVDMIMAAFAGENLTKNSDDFAKKTSIKNLEWEQIHQVLVDANFNVSQAARVLGMHRRTLMRKLEKRRVS